MIYVWVFVLFLVIWLVARYTKAGECFSKKSSFIEQMFFEAAIFIQRKFGRKKKAGLNGTAEVERIKLFLVVFMVGDIVALFLWIGGGDAGLLVDGSYISRKNAGEGSVQAQLTVKGGKDGETNVSVTVEEKIYEDAVLQALYEEMLSEMEKLVLGENTSPDCVTKDLFFAEELEGYPFFISWSSDNHLFLSASGEVATWRDVAETEKKEALVAITMRAEYKDFVREHTFFVRVCPLEGEMSFSEEVAYALETAQIESEGADELYLPQKVGEETLSWSEREETFDKTVFLLGMVGAVAVCVFGDRDSRKEREKYIAKMVAEYPAVISKLTLYLGAGLNLKGAFRKVAEEGGKIANYNARLQRNEPEENPVYREMLFTCREMESGIAEGEAYEHLGRRINKKQYIRLSMLLAQNLKKGNAELLVQLKQEAYLALEEKNREIRKAGEEAGTKLLLPMMLMLVMVMVLIMVPAFLTI